MTIYVKNSPIHSNFIHEKLTIYVYQNCDSSGDKICTSKRNNNSSLNLLIHKKKL